MAVLVTSSALHSDAWKVVSSVVYGTTLVLLYTISTVYHSVRGPAKDIFRRLDYCAIYLLIAGSYTPFALVTLRGPGAGPCSASTGGWPWPASFRNSGSAIAPASSRWPST
jgi:channel protein (hemolysin III family)